MVQGDYDVRRLMLLREVAQAGSLTMAAQTLSFTTSAVSQAIAKLEREVGLPLVERQPRGVVLTEPGRVLVGYAEALDRTLAAARSDMADFIGLRRGDLRIATFPTVAASLMPHVVTLIRQRHPDLNIVIRSARTDQIRAMLARHEVDLANLWDYPWAQTDADDLDLTTLLSDPTMLLLPVGHPRAEQPRVNLHDLAAEPWITRANHPVADVLQRVCLAAGFSPRIVLTTSDYQEIQGMVAAGLGVALAPRLAVLEHRRDLRTVPIRGNPAPRRILLAQRRGHLATPAMNAARDAFADAVRAARPASRGAVPTVTP